MIRAIHSVSRRFGRLALAFGKTLGKDVMPRVILIGWDEQFFDKEGVIVRDALIAQVR